MLELGQGSDIHDDHDDEKGLHEMDDVDSVDATTCLDVEEEDQRHELEEESPTNPELEDRVLEYIGGRRSAPSLATIGIMTEVQSRGIVLLLVPDTRAA